MSSRVRSACLPFGSRLAFGCIALAMLSACQRSEQPAVVSAQPSELTWAREALTRNPQIEVLASDAQARVFTIRNRASGQIQTIRLDELAAAPAAQLQTTPPAIVAENSQATAQTQTAPANTQAPAAERAPTARTATAEPTSPKPTTAAESKVVDNSPSAAAQRAESSESNYTIDRTGGQLRVSGPGVSIVSSGAISASTSPTTGARTTEPIICEGKRLLKLDDRIINAEGDAIIARGGCELYITNSHIVASGTGLVVEDAIVHVANSHIEGALGAFNAADRAKMFIRTSTFQGVPRRTEFASVLDQGGNHWQ